MAQDLPKLQSEFERKEKEKQEQIEQSKEKVYGFALVIGVAAVIMVCISSVVSILA